MKITSIQTPQMFKLLRGIRILILLFPLLTMIETVQKLIVESGNFIVLITVMILTYVGHQFHFLIPQNQQENCRFYILEQIRKIVVCFMSAYLIAYLIAQIYYITVIVYKVGFGQEIVFWFRVIATLSNMEANVQLCDKKHRKHTQQKA